MDCFLDPTVASVQCDKATPVAEGIKTLVATPGDRTVDAAFRLVDGRYVVCIRESTAQLVRYAARLKERNVELDRFASVVAHDLRAPLRAIGNLAEFIGEDLGDDLPEESAEHLDLLQRRVHRLDLLVDGLHQYAVAGRRGQELVQVSVDELAKEIVDEQRGDRVVTLDLAGDFPICLTEQGRLWQVLANLIGNAIRHHPRPAVLIRLTGRVDEDRLHLSVEDDGAGIDVAQRERVFQIFHSMAVAENSGGLGLGLALVKRIVAERSGTVRIEGSDLGGAAVHFDWPIREEQG
jgi:light-regulated signal transduction histidine kinase (bacteriophytochrome)